MKKAVILGNTKLNYSWFVLTFRQGLQLNGVRVFNIDYRTNSLDVIKKKVLEIKPDYMFTHLSFHPIYPINRVLSTFKQIKSKIPIKIVHVCGDARFKDRYMGDLRGSFDIALVGTKPLVINCLKAFKIPVFYTPYSTLTYKERGKYSADLAFNQPVFTGNPNAHSVGWQDNRAGFINRLRKIMDMRIFVTQSGQDLRKRTPELSTSAKCILGLCVGYEIDGYIDVRPFQYLGAGAFMIMRKFMNMDEVIPHDLYVPFDSYDDPNIVKELWNEWKNKDTSKIRENAFNYIQHYHSSEKRLKNILHILDQI